MSTGMRKWMEKGCPDSLSLPAEVSIDREELRQLRDELAQYKNERDALRAENEALATNLRGKHSITGATYVHLIAERDALRAKAEALEKQEPVAWCATDETGTVIEALGMNQSRRFDTALYLAPGAQSAQSFADAYQGAMEEVAIWKRRALEAETLNRKFIAGINGPMHMGEPAQPAQKAVAYLDLGAGGYMDIGTNLNDEQLASLPKGRHMLGIVGTYGVDGYVSAQPAPSMPEGWPTEEMTAAFARVFNVRDQYGTFPQAFRAALAAAPEPKL